MRIKTRLLLNAALPLIMGGVMAGLLLWESFENAEFTRQQLLMEEITKAVFELTLLGQEYHISGNHRRITSQWLQRYQSFGELLASARFQRKKEALNFERLRYAYKSLKYLFDKMQEARASQGTTDADSKELFVLLSEQVHVRLYEMRLYTRQLSDSNIAHQKHVLHFVHVSAMLTAGAIATLATFLSWLIGMSIIGPVARLREGSEVIGQGDLSHKVGTKAVDEIGELSRAFDRMTANLAQVTASRVRLEQEIHEREQAEAALIQAKEAAEAANKAKSSFLANMSHELRTPLNAVLGFAQLMQRDDTLPEQHRKNLEIINHSGAHLLAMINDVLDMSKIEAGQMNVEVEAFDLPQLLEDIAAMIRVRAADKGLHFILEQAPDLPRHVSTDTGKLRQILINLLGNAVKYTEEGGIALRARSRGGESGQYELLFEVEDSGRGIAVDKLPTIFDAFVQAGSSSQEGSGLGLAISKRFLELLDGKISVRSEFGTGSVFCVTLLVAAADAEAVTSPEPSRRVKGLVPDQPAYRILSVEDNTVNRALLRGILEHAGIRIREAGNGEEGLKLFLEWHPHLIWMDIRMPVMDGKEATRRIRATPEGRACKIIAITASSFVEQQNEVLSDGFDDFLRKPYRESEIFAMLERHLGMQFEYEDTPPAARIQAVRELVPEDMAGLPDAWCGQFHTAVQQGEIMQINALVSALAPEHPDLAARLASLVERYEFERLLELSRR